MAKVLTRLRIDEVSSVDRGAGEGVKIMLMKRGQPTMKNKFTEMFAKVFGGGASNDEVINKALDGLTESVSSILGDEKVDKAVALGETFNQFGDHLKETLTAGPAVVTKKEESIMDLTVLKKALGLADTATEADVTAAVAKNLADQKALQKAFAKQQQDIAAAYTPEQIVYLKAQGLDDVNDEDTDGDTAKKAAKKAFRTGTSAERATIMKAAEPEVPAYVKKMMDDNAALRKRLDDLTTSGELVSLSKAATDALLPASEAETIQKAYSGDRAAVDKLLGFVKQANATAKAGGVFKEFGSSTGTGVVDTAIEELNVLAKKVAEKDGITFAKAFAKVYEDPANVELVKRERSENRPSAA
jgi:hypothetical protein